MDSFSLSELHQLCFLLYLLYVCFMWPMPNRFLLYGQKGNWETNEHNCVTHVWSFSFKRRRARKERLCITEPLKPSKNCYIIRLVDFTIQTTRMKIFHKLWKSKVWSDKTRLNMFFLACVWLFSMSSYWGEDRKQWSFNNKTCWTTQWWWTDRNEEVI